MSAYLVATTHDGQTTIHVARQPNWDQIWGTGPYWRRVPATAPPPPKPVTQSQIGTTPDIPVYVDIKDAHGGATLLPYVAILATVGAAYIGQIVGHKKAVERDEENRKAQTAQSERQAYIAGYDRMILEASNLISRMNAANARVGTPAFPDAIDAFNEQSLLMGAAAVSFEARSGEDDPVAAEVEDLQVVAQEYWQIAWRFRATIEQTDDARDEMLAQTDTFVRRINDVVAQVNTYLNGAPEQQRPHPMRWPVAKSETGPTETGSNQLTHRHYRRPSSNGSPTATY